MKAATKSDLDIALTAHQVIVSPAGKESLTSGVAAQPGDVIQYTAVYSNTGGQALRNLAPTLPIPVGMEFIAGSASPKPAFASVDGKKFEPYPIRRTLKLADGREIVAEVPASEYRALRWTASDLSPSAAVTTIARVRVAATTVAAR